MNKMYYILENVNKNSHFTVGKSLVSEVNTAIHSKENINYVCISL